MIKVGLKISAWIIGIPVFIFVVYLLAMTITDYKPKPQLDLPIDNNKTSVIKPNKVFAITTYNIGYCGMDAGVDFFMDGGTGSRSISRSKTLENLKGVTQFLVKENSDFNLIQEIDVKSTRSFKVNEYASMIKTMNSYTSAFAYNYKVLWVPVPILKPHGNVNGGLVTLSKFKISDAKRYDYPGKEDWPRQLADLDRCLISTIIPVVNGRSLVLINSHLSAYDKGGEIRKQQLGFLKNYIVAQFKKGNYVIVGGDWNHLIPGTDTAKFSTTESWPDWLQRIPVDFKPEGFKWGADANVPSNRAVATPYKIGENFLSVIDGFLVSPNVEISRIVGHSLSFQYTDHNPVTGYFILK